MDKMLEIFVERQLQKFQECHPFFYPSPNPTKNAAYKHACAHQ